MFNPARRLLAMLHAELVDLQRIAFFTYTTGIFPAGRAVRRHWASWPEPWSPAVSESIQLGAVVRSQDAHAHMINGESIARREHSAQIIEIFPANDSGAPPILQDQELRDS